MSYDYTETNGARIDSLNMEKSRIDREPFLPSRRTRFIRFGNDLSRPMKPIIAMNDRVCVFFKMNRRLDCDRQI